MKKLIIFFSFYFISLTIIAQIEKPPVFAGCENEAVQNLEACFNNGLKTVILLNFKIPEKVKQENYKGQIKVVFIVSKKGEFEILYVNSMYSELEDEVNRIFKNLPTIQPATYNGRPVDSRYIIPISIPIDSNFMQEEIVQESTEIIDLEEEVVDVIQDNLFPEFESELNIPFTHQSYDNLVYHLNKVENTHSSFKPYIYNEVKPVVDLKKQRTELLKDKRTWGGRKLFNEHFVLVKGKNYWFTVNPIFDLQIGKDNSDVDYTYNNTRALQIQGSLGKKFSFNTSFYESQGRFADYVNDFATSNKPNDNAFGLIPGRGRAKQFKDDGFDYPVAEAYLSYTPNEFFNFQFGHGKNFIGDGYRSLFLSDAASPSVFLKISTQFWKIKYTNLWKWADDVRPGLTEDGQNLRKYIAIHHLSWNVTKNFNLGLFEAVITDNSSGNGFDIGFFNPVIFYRAIEFSRGTQAGNAQIGLDMKYKITDNFYVYNQLLIDEMTVGEVFSGSGYWGNKFGLQFGGKYFNAFKVENLMLQGEFNWVRPYTNSHQIISLNYGHFNQPLSHLWGGNFWEAIAIARYNKNRWFGSMKFIIGEKGFDFENSNVSYGGDIYKSYNDRVSDYGNEIAQGNTTNIFIADIQAGYIINPATNLQLFGGLTIRNIDPIQSSSNSPIQNTTWFTVGLKSEIFNWYFDF